MIKSFGKYSNYKYVPKYNISREDKDKDEAAWEY